MRVLVVDDEPAVRQGQPSGAGIRAFGPPARGSAVDRGRHPARDDPDETKADLIDGLLGEASSFQETHGIYAQGVGQHTARLPEGWEDRLVALKNDNTGGVTGRCLEPHDVCVSKLLAGRPKDNEFCQALVRAGVVDPTTLLERLEFTDATPDERQHIEVMIENAA